MLEKDIFGLTAKVLHGYGYDAAEALEEVQKANDLNWTCRSTAENFVAAGHRTGKCIGDDELLVNAAGNSEISYAYYPVAMLDEVERGKHIQGAAVC